MITKYIGLDQNDLYDKVGNILNKVAESMKNKDNEQLMSQYQPDGFAQDKRLIDDAFKSAVKDAIRKMSPYIDNTPDDLAVYPKSIVFANRNVGETKIIRITSSGEWALSIGDNDGSIDNGNDSIPANATFVIKLAFPDSWLDVDILQDYVEDFVTRMMIANYLENVDKTQASWYTKKADETGHDIRTMCAARKPGTRFGVTNPFGESLNRY